MYLTSQKNSNRKAHIMAQKKTAQPADVRKWLRSDEGQAAIEAFNAKADAKNKVTTYVGDRGRFQPVHRDLFAKAHPNMSYSDKDDRTPTVEFKHKALDKRGRNITKTVRLTLAEQRALLGQPDSKARVNRAQVVAALEAAAGIVAPVADAPAPVADGSVEKV